MKRKYKFLCSDFRVRYRTVVSYLWARHLIEQRGHSILADHA